MDIDPVAKPSPMPTAPNPSSGNAALTFLVLLLVALTVGAFVHCIRALRRGMDYERDLMANSRLMAEQRSQLERQAEALGLFRQQVAAHTNNFQVLQDTLGRQREALTKEIAGQTGERDGLEASLRPLREEYAQLTADIDNLRAEWLSAKQSVASVLGEYVSMTNTLARLRQERAELGLVSNDLVARTAERDALKAECDQKRQELGGVLADLAQAQGMRDLAWREKERAEETPRRPP